MSTIGSVANDFFEACETGKGWEGCRSFCLRGATFTSQAEPLADLTSLEQYTEWMKNLLTLLSNTSYEVKSLAIDEARKNVCAYAVYSGTHTGEGGPVPPTGESTKADYVYVMEFDGDKIRHMTKIWNSGWTLKELGWT